MVDLADSEAGDDGQTQSGNMVEDAGHAGRTGPRQMTVEKTMFWQTTQPTQMTQPTRRPQQPVKVRQMRLKNLESTFWYPVLFSALV